MFSKTVKFSYSVHLMHGTHYRLSFAVCPSVLVTLDARLRQYYSRDISACTEHNRDALHNIALYKFLIPFYSILFYSILFYSIQDILLSSVVQDFSQLLSVTSCVTTFLARDSIYAVACSALYAIPRPSVRPSVSPSHGWISQRRLKLGSCNLHHRVAP